MTLQEAIKVVKPQGNSAEDLTAAYRILAKKYHPDLNPDGGENMKKLRTVEKIRSGDRFIEVAAKDHAAVLAAYLADSKNNPCPMIRGHQMFKHPKDYGCRLVNP